MMELFFSEAAKKELGALPKDVQAAFVKHLEKMESIPPRRHMKYGIPCHVEEVSKQARIVYETRGEKTYVLHCFKTHKEYERWYKSYK